MRRLLRSTLLVALAPVALAACSGGTGPDIPPPPEISVRPSGQLSQAVQSGSGQFTWSLARDQITVRLASGDFSDTLKLCAVQVVGGEDRDTQCTPSFEVSSAELSGGASTADLVPPDAPPFLPGEEWFPLEQWAPTELILPSEFNFPRQNNVVNALTSSVDLGPDEGMVIVFAATDNPFTVPGEGEIPFRVQPFALKLTRKQAE